MDIEAQQKLQKLARTALFGATAYLVVLGCVLLSQAFDTAVDGSLAFKEGWGEEQATKGYFFHVIAGLLILVWYARGSRSKFPLAFASLGCLVAGTWTYVSFSAPMVGLFGLLPGAFCGMVFGYRLRNRRNGKSRE